MAQQPLFQFDPSFITSVCMGGSNADVAAKFRDAYEDGRLKLRSAVRDRMRQADRWRDAAERTDVKLGREGYVVVLPAEYEDELLDLEYGGPDTPMQPIQRQAVSQSRIDVERAIARALDFD